MHLVYDCWSAGRRVYVNISINRDLAHLLSLMLIEYANLGRLEGGSRGHTISVKRQEDVDEVQLVQKLEPKFM